MWMIILARFPGSAVLLLSSSLSQAAMEHGEWPISQEGLFLPDVDIARLFALRLHANSPKPLSVYVFVSLTLCCL